MDVARSESQVMEKAYGMDASADVRIEKVEEDGGSCTCNGT